MLRCTCCSLQKSCTSSLLIIHTCTLQSTLHAQQRRQGLKTAQLDHLTITLLQTNGFWFQEGFFMLVVRLFFPLMVNSLNCCL